MFATRRARHGRRAAAGHAAADARSSYNPYGSLVYIVDDKSKGPDGKPQLVARQVFVTHRRYARRSGLRS